MIVPSFTGTSSGTFENFASERSITKRGGSAIENVVKFGGFDALISRTTLPPSSRTPTDVMTFRSAWARAVPAAAARRASARTCREDIGISRKKMLARIARGYRPPKNPERLPGDISLPRAQDAVRPSTRRGALPARPCRARREQRARLAHEVQGACDAHQRTVGGAPARARDRLGRRRVRVGVHAERGRERDHLGGGPRARRPGIDDVQPPDGPGERRQHAGVVL